MATDKPKKPYPTYPLFPHANGQWAKKVKGTIRYFGAWENPEAAINRYLAQIDYLKQGRKPPIEESDRTAPKLQDLTELFINEKEGMLASGELSQHTMTNYRNMCEYLIEFFKGSYLLDEFRPADFMALRKDMAKDVGLVALSNRVRVARIIFKYAYDSELIDKPIRFGPGFKSPSKKSLRAEKNTRNKKMFESNEVKSLIEKADTSMRAAILLGVNCGFGNTDCAAITKDCFDFDAAFVQFPRTKTAIDRRCPLWPETIEAVKAVIALGRVARNEDDRGLVFITKYGHRWVRHLNDAGDVQDAFSKEFRKITGDLGIHRRGVGFYALRHVFETIGGEAMDQVAVDFMMGHAPKSDDMASQYRERISDKRLKAVTDHIHSWIWGIRVWAEC